MTTESTGAEQSLVGLVDVYCRRVCPAVLAQHNASSITSPLGIWLLLAMCASAATHDQKSALEEALGCTTTDGMLMLRRFLNDPPRALHSALALWVRSSDRSSPLVEWTATLPRAVERGPIPSQEVADGWAPRTLIAAIRTPVGPHKVDFDQAVERHLPLFTPEGSKRLSGPTDCRLRLGPLKRCEPYDPSRHNRRFLFMPTPALSLGS